MTTTRVGTSVAKSKNTSKRHNGTWTWLGGFCSVASVVCLLMHTTFINDLNKYLPVLRNRGNLSLATNDSLSLAHLQLTAKTPPSSRQRVRRGMQGEAVLIQKQDNDERQQKYWLQKQNPYEQRLQRKDGDYHYDDRRERLPPQQAPYVAASLLDPKTVLRPSQSHTNMQQNYHRFPPPPLHHPQQGNFRPVVANLQRKHRYQTVDVKHDMETNTRASRQQWQSEPQVRGLQHSTSLSTWDDMDLHKDVTRCGADKCFFPSLTDQSVGYLVAGSSQLPAMKGSFQLALRLQDQYGMHHFNLPEHPPILIPVGAKRLVALNQLVQQPGREAQGLPKLDVYGTETDQEDLEHVVVQPVQRAPEPHLFLTIGYSQALTEKSLAEFAPHIVKATTAQEFHVRLGRELVRIQQVLRDNPIIYRDFQGLVDVYGNFYAIDLDVWDEWRDSHHSKENIDRILDERFAFLEDVRAQLWTLSVSAQSSRR